ncbi:P1 family peptidase [Sphaerisporangium flaviroseum]|uniref:P1 family peptidase n=1 Tax=Sphaerisporangium flaviroseum TaxID=509199 RepID=A0ABP7HF80_9ACTN
MTGLGERARDLGITIGDREPGEHDAITDVPGVRVGHRTIVREPGIRTGVTAIVPDGVGPHAPLPAGLFTGNGHGKLVGATQVAELGQIESPIVLTSTLSAFRAADALVSWMLARPDCVDVRSFNPVVGECNDGYLSDIRVRPVGEAEVLEAIEDAARGPVAEGCVGAGTGTGALGFKAGIGTASRTLDLAGEPVTLGVLVQANFGGTLRVLGTTVTPAHFGMGESAVQDAGSCMIVAATDAPLDARQLTRLARRTVFGLGRVGASYSHGSGDYGIAFSVRPDGRPPRDQALSPLFEAALDAVEEAVLNSLFTATTMRGTGGRVLHAIPIPGLIELLGRSGSFTGDGK